MVAGNLTLADSGEPEIPHHDLDWEVVAELDQAPGNLTVTPEGRIFVSVHQHFSPDLRMAEVDPEDSTRLIPFPNEPMAMIADGKEVAIRRPDGSTFNPKVAVNPIALDAAGQYLYYGPINAGKDVTEPPFHIIRFKPLAPGVIGR